MSAVHSNFGSNKTVNGATQDLPEPATAQNGESLLYGNVIHTFLQCDTEEQCMAAFHRAITPAGLLRQARRSLTPVVSPTPPPSSASTSSSSSSNAIVARVVSSSSTSVAQERQSMVAARAVDPLSLPSLPIDSNGHPYLNTLLRYASAYASGFAISGGILSRREEAEAVLISLCHYIEFWRSLHSTDLYEHEEYLQDLGRIIRACVSLEVQLRTEEGASDQVVLAEAIEEWACNRQRQCLSSLADMQRGVITQEVMRKELRYDITYTPYLPEPSAPAQTHAEFLIERRDIGIPMMQLTVEMKRKHFTNTAQFLRDLWDAMALYNHFVDIRAGEQIISYIKGTYCTIDDIGPSSFEQFMELSNDEKVRLIQRLLCAIEQNSPDKSNATVRSMVEGIHSYLAITHPSREYRKQVADSLLIYLFKAMTDMWCRVSGCTDAAKARNRQCLRYIVRIVPPLRRLLSTLRRQFYRDGLIEHGDVVDSFRDKLRADALMAKYVLRLEEFENNTQATPDALALSNFPIPTRQNNRIFQGVSAEYLVSMRNTILTQQNIASRILGRSQSDSNKQLLKHCFLVLHSYGRFLRFLGSIRPFPRITPPVATITATSSSSSSTTTAQGSSPSPEPTTTTSTTTTTTTLPAVAPIPGPVPPLPESDAESLATTTTTTTIAQPMARRQRPALNDQPREPRKTSSTANCRTITADQIRMLSRPNLLRLIREMELDVDTGGGRGSLRRVRNKDGKVVAVLPDHRRKDTLSWRVAYDLYAAGQSGKEKQSS